MDYIKLLHLYQLNACCDWFYESSFRIANVFNGRSDFHRAYNTL